MVVIIFGGRALYNDQLEGKVEETYKSTNITLVALGHDAEAEILEVSQRRHWGNEDDHKSEILSSRHPLCFLTFSLLPKPNPPRIDIP